MLFGSILENKISKWAEERDKCAKVQASFRPKHSTVDHAISSRHLQTEHTSSIILIKQIELHIYMRYSLKVGKLSQ